MSLNETVSAERLHIAFFGKRNAGKSSLVNAVTGQTLSVVSPIKGTTTDPVKKAMELLPLGPVLIIDTPGYDDDGALGTLRVEKTKEILHQTELAVLVYDAVQGLTEEDRALISAIRGRSIPLLLAANKCDLLPSLPPTEPDTIPVSARTGAGVNALKEAMAALGKRSAVQKQILADLVAPGDTVILVIPIDESAPKGRLILPQQQTIRDLLDAGAAALVVRDTELAELLRSLGKKPSVVITDSQAFAKVKDIVPDDVRLTSFSILMARYKCFLETAVAGAAAIERLQDGDRVLISEGCTHHRQCDDIGTVKLPNWLRKYTGKDIVIETSSGKGFPEDLSPYKLVIHCGGCMLNEREMRYRRQFAGDSGVPFTNYGTAIAYMNGILKRTLSVFPDLQKTL